MIYILLFIVIFSNQYLLFNEELFIILAFFCLCFFVQNSLGSVVENELSDRKTKILNSYLEFLRKKSLSANLNSKNIGEKISYLFNVSKIQESFFNKFDVSVDLSKIQNLTDFVKNFDLKFFFYFANLVNKKRKFLI